jgi:broad specificity phosphatase PhoE
MFPSEPIYPVAELASDNARHRVQRVLRRIDAHPRSGPLLIVAHAFVVDIAISLCGSA